MHIKSVTLRNFGPIESLDLDLPPTGVHLLVGRSASGKSHVAGALLHALSGGGLDLLEEKPQGALPGLVRVTLAEGQTRQEVEVSTGRDSLTRVLHLSGDHDALGEAWRTQGNRGMPRMVLNDESHHAPESGRLPPAGVFDEVQDGAGESDVLHRLGWRRGASSEALPAGLEVIADIAVEFSRRRGFALSLPLILDGSFDRLDMETAGVAARILAAIGKRSQVLVIGGLSIAQTLRSAPSSTLADRSSPGQSALAMKRGTWQVLDELWQSRR